LFLRAAGNRNLDDCGPEGGNYIRKGRRSRSAARARFRRGTVVGAMDARLKCLRKNARRLGYGWLPSGATGWRVGNGALKCAATESTAKAVGRVGIEGNCVVARMEKWKGRRGVFTMMSASAGAAKFGS